MTNAASPAPPKRPKLPKTAGQWSLRPTRERYFAISPQTRQQLQALGYVDGSQPAAVDVGVLKHVAGKAQRGLSFVVSGHMPGAFLMDMDGSVLHEWRRSRPRLSKRSRCRRAAAEWQHPDHGVGGGSRIRGDARPARPARHVLNDHLREKKLPQPEVAYFLEHFAGSFTKTLDELN